MADREQAFQKMMALYPLWNGDPQIDQFELRNLAAMLSGIAPRPDRLVLQPQMPGATGSITGGPAALLSGPSATQDISQRSRGMQNRNTVEAGTGRQVPANRTY